MGESPSNALNLKIVDEVIMIASTKPSLYDYL